MSVTLQYPTMLERIKSTLIDTVIVIAAMFAISEILNLFDHVPDYVRIILFILVIMYEPLCTAFGSTVGNDRMNIRVRQNSDPSQRINLFQATLRFLIKFALGWLSFITIFTSKQNKAIHDYVSGSLMIRL